ncbi:hypothetical protein JZ751_004348 [Albula glossodonta]|uniref:Uncharacterized protein n=1 Tax=Albula glossodonta TaxID=121402 RepID=A0A8T2N5N4_9TELE|nr:hypothetical protein JZ751_004348 [Albula glossodonta]
MCGLLHTYAQGGGCLSVKTTRYDCQSCQSASNTAHSNRPQSGGMEASLKPGAFLVHRAGQRTPRLGRQPREPPDDTPSCQPARAGHFEKNSSLITWRQVLGVKELLTAEMLYHSYADS